jgi:hypothetical protein
MRWRIGIISLALATVSCGASGSSDPTTGPAAPAPTSAGAPVAEGSYESVREMQKDVESAFYLCSAPMKVYDPPEVDLALAQADCSSIVTFLIFEPSDVQASAADLQSQADGASVLLVGENWIINCSSDEAVCVKIQGRTGGELTVSTP